jgi:hypothetical protein
MFLLVLRVNASKMLELCCRKDGLISCCPTMPDAKRDVPRCRAFVILAAPTFHLSTDKPWICQQQRIGAR